MLDNAPAGPPTKPAQLRYADAIGAALMRTGRVPGFSNAQKNLWKDYGS